MPDPAEGRRPCIPRQDMIHHCARSWACSHLVKLAVLVQGGKTWISEMYGYLFAAANSSVWHRQLDYSANLVPGVGPIGARRAWLHALHK